MGDRQLPRNHRVVARALPEVASYTGNVVDHAAGVAGCTGIVDRTAEPHTGAGRFRERACSEWAAPILRGSGLAPASVAAVIGPTPGLRSATSCTGAAGPRGRPSFHW